MSTQERKFICYVRELIESFRKNGSLRGIAMIGRGYGVSTLTKEQFFRFGLHEDKEFTDEYLLGLYEKAKTFVIMEDIIIKRDGNFGFDVWQGNKHSNHLGYDEMLGLISALTMPEEQTLPSMDEI